MKNTKQLLTVVGIVVFAIIVASAQQVPAPAQDVAAAPQGAPGAPAPPPGRASQFADPNNLPPVLRNYRNVTRGRLLRPEDENWLMVRRTYDGWGYTPLDDI